MNLFLGIGRRPKMIKTKALDWGTINYYLLLQMWQKGSRLIYFGPMYDYTIQFA